jgi:hypothetical protein
LIASLIAYACQVLPGYTSSIFEKCLQAMTSFVFIIKMDEEWYAKYYDDDEYERRKAHIQTHGTHATLKWQESHYYPLDHFYSLRVEFPDDFQHLTLPKATKEKENTSEGFHISLGYQSYLKGTSALEQLETLKKQFKYPQSVHFPNVWVSNGGSYMLAGDDKLMETIRAVSQIGTGKDDPHISTG